MSSPSYGINNPSALSFLQVNHVRIVLPEYNGGILVMCIGVTSGISRLIFGVIADLPSINRIRMQQFALIFLSIITACIPFIRHFYVLMALTLLMGVFDGCFICLLGPIAFDLLGPSGAAQGLGCLLSLSSIPMTAGPPLAGMYISTLLHQHTCTLSITI